MMETQVAKECRREIEDLHRFFVDWFHGAIPDEDVVWRRLEDALAPGFVLISPGGDLLARDDLLTALRERHGCHGPEAGFDIWIRHDMCRHAQDRLALATYEEWQRLHGEERGRLSTVLFERDERAPNGLRWLHVHETWLPDEDDDDASGA